MRSVFRKYDGKDSVLRELSAATTQNAPRSCRWHGKRSAIMLPARELSEIMLAARELSEIMLAARELSGITGAGGVAPPGVATRWW